MNAKYDEINGEFKLEAFTNLLSRVLSRSKGDEDSDNNKKKKII